jgi:hypothetical protein
LIHEHRESFDRNDEKNFREDSIMGALTGEHKGIDAVFMLRFSSSVIYTVSPAETTHATN